MTCWALVFTLSLAAVACSTDDPTNDGSTPATTTRTPSGDDAGDQSKRGTTILVDTTWAGETTYDFDGNPITPPATTIPLPDGDVETGDAQDAV